MSKRVKISLIFSLVLFVVGILFNLLFPSLRFAQRKIDIIIVTFISSLIVYVFTYFLIKGLEQKDKLKEKK